ncbi:hypothetical protein ACZ11_15665 [Lysinibacillus xylanilyticus]|uniref:Uncharacterized protein n=1 Tax=Lysinibacillus xylanilyticus TaxID=582475 RepID=A0A0K9F6D8_9BACI|nr:hypothetical protein [Lysinibacillus xylanilyticus]KMY30139.1 hypothetical protein ACZ11_15665 [Lysinibacillus xylanilyticus]
MGISDRGTKAKTITSCDNAFVTNVGAAAATLTLRFRAKNICWPETLERSEAAHRTPQEALLCAKAKRQQQSAQPERKSSPRFDEQPHFI